MNHRIFPGGRSGRLRFLIALAFLPLGLASCEEGPAFGMPASRFLEILEEGELEPILALGPAELADPGSAGPEAYYYLARWLEQRIPARPSPPTANPPPPPAANGFSAVSPELPLPPALGAAEAEAAEVVASKPRLPDESIPREWLLAEELYRLALKKTKGLLQAEAGKALLRLLEERAAATERGSPQALAAWTALLTEARQELPSAEYAWEAGRLGLAALEALGRDAELRREVSELAKAFPAEAARAWEELLYYEAISSLHLGMKASAGLLQNLLEAPASLWTERGLRALEEAEPAIAARLGTALPAAARLRLAVRAKDYAAAYRFAGPALPLILDPQGDPSLLADAGKAYLYSGMSKEGLPLFERILASAGAPAPARPLAWNAAFYRARFLRALERWSEAAEGFLALEAGAPRAEDADAALWYAADSRMKAAAAAKASGPSPKAGAAEGLQARALRERNLAALLEIAPRWHEASRFSDLAEPLLREGLVARDWAFLAAYAEGLGPRLAPTLGSRAAYLAARARELGYLIPESPESAPGPSTAVSARAGASAAAAAGYRAVLDRAGSSLYYRLLAARRLGEELPLIPLPAGKPGSREAGAEEADGAGKGESEIRAFIEGFLKFRLGDQGYAEAVARLELIGREELRALAEAFSRAGRHADSMRLVLALMRREDWDPRRRDYELLYPRPFLDEIRAIRPRPLSPEHLLYGLVRSESFFRHEVKSRAGAIGLSQLMPGTAEETARALGLGGYDLTKPADNLKIGFAHFGELLAESGGRPLRAMFAYNAGRGRLRRWLAEFGDLPEDLLLESLSIEETRQYGRNILEASAFYGRLYYDRGPGEVVDEFLGGLEISRD